MPNNVAACEDDNFPDILDSDCWNTRYTNIRNSYSSLSTVSSRVASVNNVMTGSALNTLRSFKPATVNPTLNRYIANALTDMDSRTSLAVNSLKSLTNGTSWVNATAGQGLASAISSLSSYTASEISSMTRVGANNINKLVNIANSLNANSSLIPIHRQLQNLISNSQKTVSDHSAFVFTNQLGDLAKQRDWISSLVFDSSNKFNNSYVNPIIGAVTRSAANRASFFTGTATSRLNSIISPTYLSSQIASLSSGIRSAITNFNTSLPSRSLNRMSSMSSQFPSIVKNYNDLSTLINANATAISSLTNKYMNGSAITETANKYTPIVTNSTTLTRLSGTNYTVAQSNFLASANLQLARLTNALVQAQSYMSSGSQTASSTSSNRVMSEIVNSLASVGNIQQQINKALLQRNTANLNAMQDLTNKLQASGVSFANMTASITALTQALSGLTSSSSSSNSSTNQLANMIVDVLNSLGQIPVLVQQQSTASVSQMTSTNNTIKSTISTYSGNVTNRFGQYFVSGNSPGTWLRNNITSGIANGAKNVSSTLKRWKNINTTSSNTAMLIGNNISSASSSLGGISSGVASTIGVVASYVPIATTSLLSNIPSVQTMIGTQYFGIANDLKTNIDLASSQFLPLISAAESNFDNYMTGHVADSDDSFQAQVGIGNATMEQLNSSFIPPLKSEIGGISGSSYDTAIRTRNFASDMQTGPETTLNESVSAFSSKFNSLPPLNGEGTTVTNTIASYMQPGQFDDTAAGILDRVSQQSENLITVAKIVPLVIQILQLTDPLFDPQTGLKSFTEIVKYMNSAKTIDSILQQETTVLSNLLTNSFVIQNKTIESIANQLTTDWTSLISDFVSKGAKFSPSAALVIANKTLTNNYTNTLNAETYMSNRPTRIPYNFANAIQSNLSAIVSSFQTAGSQYQMATEARIEELENEARAKNLSDPNAYATQHTSVASEMLSRIKILVAQSSSSVSGALLDALDEFQTSMNDMDTKSVANTESIANRAKSVLSSALKTINDTLKAESILEQAEQNAKKTRGNSISSAVLKLTSLSALTNAAFVNAVQSAVSQNSAITQMTNFSPLSLPIITGKILSQWIAANMTTDSSLKMFDNLRSDFDSQIDMENKKIKSVISNTTEKIRAVSTSLTNGMIPAQESYQDNLRDMQNHIGSEYDNILQILNTITSEDDDHQVDVSAISSLSPSNNYQSDSSRALSDIDQSIEDVTKMISTATR